MISYIFRFNEEETRPREASSVPDEATATEFAIYCGIATESFDQVSYASLMTSRSAYGRNLPYAVANYKEGRICLLNVHFPSLTLPSPLLPSPLATLSSFPVSQLSRLLSISETGVRVENVLNSISQNMSISKFSRKENTFLLRGFCHEKYKKG